MLDHSGVDVVINCLSLKRSSLNCKHTPLLLSVTSPVASQVLPSVFGAAHCCMCLVAESLSFEQAAKLLSKTGSTAFPGEGNAIAYASQDASGEPRNPACLLICYILKRGIGDRVSGNFDASRPAFFPMV